MIGHIHGLDNLSASAAGVMPRNLKPLAQPAALADSASDSTAPGIRVNGFSNPFFGANDFYTFYNETPLIASGLKGASCIGLVGDSKFLPSAVAAFNAKFKLGASHITTVLADPGPAQFNDDEVEADLAPSGRMQSRPARRRASILATTQIFRLTPSPMRLRPR